MAELNAEQRASLEAFARTLFGDDGLPEGTTFEIEIEDDEDVTLHITALVPVRVPYYTCECRVTPKKEGEE